MIGSSISHHVNVSVYDRDEDSRLLVSPTLRCHCPKGRRDRGFFFLIRATDLIELTDLK